MGQITVQINDSHTSGAVYVYSHSGATWNQLSYVKVSSSGNFGDEFGNAVSLNSNGNSLLVGPRYEDSDATGVGGDQGNNNKMLLDLFSCIDEFILAIVLFRLK